MSLKVSDLETDARRASSTRDPPGQRSIYIPPGPPERETYRLSTFKDFPTNVQVDPCQLAASGFYYTGYQDRVKCFSCGQAVDSWVVGDEPKSPNWHQPGCGMVNGTDTNNIPILAFIHHLRRNSEQVSPSTSKTTLPGFSQQRFSQNQPRRVEAGSTTSFGNQNDSQLSSNVSAPPETRHGAPIRNLHPHLTGFSTASKGASNGILQSNSGNQDLTTFFPCRNPINPHMRRMEARLQTFSDNSATWSSYTIRATPEEIADAGMYCLGERDRAKCWYCNGGLQNWDFDDDPWVEHAKYFPMCEYVLQRKGPEFVHSIVAQFPNLRRPTLYNPSTAAPANRIANIVRFQPRLSQSNSGLNASEQAPEIVDPQEEMRLRLKKIEEDMKSSEFVVEARTMSFEDRVIREALKRKYEASNHGFQDLASLVEALLELVGEDISEDHKKANASNAPLSCSTDHSHADTKLDEMRRMKESKLCKSCKKEIAVMVFIPCGHLACCVECGKSLKKCPICKTLIRERVRTFLS